MGLLYVGFNGEPIFQPQNVNHAIYAKIVDSIKNAYEMQTHPSRDDNLIGRS
jgi:hypothetical protein